MDAACPHGVPRFWYIFKMCYDVQLHGSLLAKVANAFLLNRDSLTCPGKLSSAGGSSSCRYQCAHDATPFGRYVRPHFIGYRNTGDVIVGVSSASGIQENHETVQGRLLSGYHSSGYGIVIEYRRHVFIIPDTIVCKKPNSSRYPSPHPSSLFYSWIPVHMVLDSAGRGARSCGCHAAWRDTVFRYRSSCFFSKIHVCIRVSARHTLQSNCYP